MPEEILNEFKALEAGSAFISKNFKNLQKQYPNRFIAVEDSHMIAEAPSFEEISERLKEKNKELNKVIIEFIPQKGEIILY